MAAVAAIILGTGVSAAVTGGRSVNPVIGVQQVVAQLTGGRTPEQKQVYEADLKHVQAAREQLGADNRTEAITQLNRIVYRGLSPEDEAHIRAEAEQLKKLLSR